MCLTYILCVPSVVGWKHFSSSIKQHFHFHLSPILCHVTVTVNTVQLSYKKKTICLWNFSGRQEQHMWLDPLMHKVRGWPPVLSANIFKDAFSPCFHLNENWPPGQPSHYNHRARSLYKEVEHRCLKDGKPLRVWLPCLSHKEVIWSLVLRSFGTLWIISHVHLPCVTYFWIFITL